MKTRQTKKTDKDKNLNNRVSVVIPNYNGQHLLRKFLPSVISELKNGDELIIVDDCSTDHSINWLIKYFKLKLTKKSFYKNEIPKNYNPNIFGLDFKMYSNTIKSTSSKLNSSNNKKTPFKKITISLVSQLVNLRFAATSNFGVLIAKNNNVLLLNNDVKLIKGTVNQLLNNFTDNKSQKNKDVFAVGCLEYEKNKQGDKSGKNKLWFSRGLFQHSKAKNFKSGKTAWVSGGSGMFDRGKWLELGGFDKAYYPAYWEDLDLSFRARKKGWRVLFDEKAVVYHVHESTNIDEFGENKIDKMSWNNILKFTLKNGNLWQKFNYYIFKYYWVYLRSKLKKI